MGKRKPKCEHWYNAYFWGVMTGLIPSAIALYVNPIAGAVAFAVIVRVVGDIAENDTNKGEWEV